MNISKSNVFFFFLLRLQYNLRASFKHFSGILPKNFLSFHPWLLITEVWESARGLPQHTRERARATGGRGGGERQRQSWGEA